MNITDKTWTKHSSWLFVRGRLWSADESFVKEPGVGCQSFTLRSLRSFEKNFWSCRHEGRERRLCLALRMCHRRLMAPCERKKTHTWSYVLLSDKTSDTNTSWHKHILTQIVTVAVTCWEYSRLSRSPPPRWSSPTDCVATGLSPPPGPSSSDLQVWANTWSYSLLRSILHDWEWWTCFHFSCRDTVAAEESVYSLQGVFMVRMTDYSQGTGGGRTTGTVCHSPSPGPPHSSRLLRWLKHTLHCWKRSLDVMEVHLKPVFLHPPLPPVPWNRRSVTCSHPLQRRRMTRCLGDCCRCVTNWWIINENTHTHSAWSSQSQSAGPPQGATSLRKPGCWLKAKWVHRTSWTSSSSSSHLLLCFFFKSPINCFAEFPRKNIVNLLQLYNYFQLTANVISVQYLSAASNWTHMEIKLVDLIINEKLIDMFPIFPIITAKLHNNFSVMITDM